MSSEHIEGLLFCTVSRSRALLTLLHQETTSLFEPAEWRGRPQGGISLPLLPQQTRPWRNNLWSLTMSTTSMYPWSHCVLLTWTPLQHQPQVTLRTSDWLLCFKTILAFFQQLSSRNLHKIVFFLSLFFVSTDSHAELGSRPSVEGPMDPDGSGPTEFTEQTLDADSQVWAKFLLLTLGV